MPSPIRVPLTRIRCVDASMVTPLEIVRVLPRSTMTSPVSTFGVDQVSSDEMLPWVAIAVGTARGDKVAMRSRSTRPRLDEACMRKATLSTT